MPRYNTSLATNSITGATTISSPFQGAFTALAGTAPYTVTLPSPVLYPGSNQTFYNSTAGTITLSTPSGNFTGTGGTNTSTVSCFAGNVVSVTSDGTNYIVISEDGSPLIATTGLFSSDVTMNGSTANINISPGGLVTINPSLTSAINNVNIGGTTRGSGAFTTLSANSSVSFTANTASSSTGTGTLVVTGGIGVSGNINSGGTVSAVSLSGPLTGTIQTASQPNITSVGELTVPSITITKTGASALANFRTAGSGIGNSIVFNRARGTLAAPTVADGGAYIGTIDWNGYDGTNYVSTATMRVVQDSTISANVLRSRFELHNVDSAGALQQRVTVDINGQVGINSGTPASRLDVVETVATNQWTRITARETASNSAFIGTYRSGSTYSTGVFAHNYALSAWQDLYINAHNDGSGGIGGGTAQRIVMAGKVGINLISPAANLHVSAGTPTGIGSVPAGSNILIDSTSTNLAVFRSTSDNATNSGIAMQDNNIGGYVLFRNYDSSNSAISDRMFIAGYQGVNIQYGTADSTVVTARTNVASFDSNGITLLNGDFKDNKGYIKHASYDWKWHARRWATGYVSDVRTNISGRFWNETAAPTDEVYLHTQDLSSVSYIGENIWGDVHNYKAWAVTCIYVKRAFTISATLNGDDPYALYINKSYVTGSDGCCTGVAYTYSFTPGWYRLEMVYSEAGGGHYVQLGWNIRDYLGNISAMTPFGPYG